MGGIGTPLGRLLVEEPWEEALIPVECRLCSDVMEFDLLLPPAPSSSFMSDTLTSIKIFHVSKAAGAAARDDDDYLFSFNNENVNDTPRLLQPPDVLKTDPNLP